MPTCNYNFAQKQSNYNQCLNAQEKLVPRVLSNMQFE